MAFPAFFDACAIYGITLSDLLLRLADDGVFRPLWSEQGLDEVRRNAVAAGVSPSGIDRRLSMMRTYFPPASLAVLDVETVHPDDFLLDQLDLFPGVVTRVLRELAEDYVDPPQSVEDILDTLRRAGVPRFADDVRRYL